MQLFRITVKSRVNSNGIRLEPGMSVDVVLHNSLVILFTRMAFRVSPTPLCA